MPNPFGSKAKRHAIFPLTVCVAGRPWRRIWRQYT